MDDEGKPPFSKLASADVGVRSASTARRESEMKM
jgi:hypothetical protein